MNWYREAELRGRSVTVQNMGGYREILPIITLRGKWLMEAGFYPHDKLNIAVSKDSITLTVAQKSEDSRTYHETLLREREEYKVKRKQELEQGTPIRIPKG